MPCGTGKSLTAFWIAEKMKSKSILVAVPSLVSFTTNSKSLDKRIFTS